MIHVNYCNQKHFWTTNKSEENQKLTYQEVIEKFYTSKMSSYDIKNKHNEFLFYLNGNLLMDHSINVRIPKGVYEDIYGIYVLKKVELKKEDEYF